LTLGGSHLDELFLRAVEELKKEAEEVGVDDDLRSEEGAER
jgi:hypothetical protein